MGRILRLLPILGLLAAPSARAAINPWLAAERAHLHLQFEIAEAPPAPAAPTGTCSTPVLARRVFAAEAEWSQPPYPRLPTIRPGDRLTVELPCARPWRVEDGPPVPAAPGGFWAINHHALRPGTLYEAYLDPKDRPDGPCGNARAIEPDLWVAGPGGPIWGIDALSDTPQWPRSRRQWARVVPTPPPPPREGRPLPFPSRSAIVTYTHSAQPGEIFRAAYDHCSQRLRIERMSRSGQPLDGWTLHAGSEIHLVSDAGHWAERQSAWSSRRGSFASDPNNARVEREGTDTIAGLPCTIWRIEETPRDIREGRASAGVARACITADGIQLRREGPDGAVLVSRVEYVPELPDERFRVPEGYTIRRR